MTNGEKVERLLEALVKFDGGDLTIAYSPDDETSPWLVGSTFGQEAEDSPMAGGAVYGAAVELGDALDQALSDL